MGSFDFFKEEDDDELPQLTEDVKFWRDLAIKRGEELAQAQERLAGIYTIANNSENYESWADSNLALIDIEAQAALSDTPSDYVVVPLSFIKGVVKLTISASDWAIRYKIDALNGEALKINEAIFADDRLKDALGCKEGE